MPDGFSPIGRTGGAIGRRRFRQRWVSPLLRRILLVNALPLALLVLALLYLDQYQNGLLESQVAALREQARVFAGALGESAVRTTDPDNPKLVPEVAASLLRRLTEPTPDADAKLYAPDGSILANSRQRQGPGGQVTMEPLPPAGAVHPAAPGAIDADRPDTKRRRPRLATERQGGAAAQQLRRQQSDTSLYKAHARQPSARHRRRAGRTRQAYRRHHLADA